jgi:hypothetical protein
MTKSEIGEVTKNTIATSALKTYLSSINAEIIKETLYGEYVTAKIQISTLNNILSTEFYNFTQTENPSTFIRCIAYTMPIGIIYIYYLLIILILLINITI